MKKRTKPSTSETAGLPNAVDAITSGWVDRWNKIDKPAPPDNVGNAIAVLARLSNGAVHQVNLNALEHGAVRAVVRALFRDRVPVFADPLPGVSLIDPTQLRESELVVGINKPSRKRVAKKAAAKKAAAKQTRKTPE